jgi:flavin reductase (DIM6/NTAB) family NADH-FMN oxidoreductase RutF
LPVSAEQFKEVFRRWASGIAIVTTRRAGGIHGMTANSFCSLSLDPPLVLICVEKRTHTHALIADQRAFGIHLLAQGQDPLSEACAGHAGEPGHWLEGMSHHAERTGAPILDDCAAWLDCSLWATYEGGDHTIYVGQIEAAAVTGRPPLLWFDRHYRQLADEGRQ